MEDGLDFVEKIWGRNEIIQELSNRTHGPRTPKKPEYLIALLATSLVRSVGIRSHASFDGNKVSQKKGIKYEDNRYLVGG